ncbi:phosphoribosylanthranilate isomerase [Candidatus Vidania fulgoroideae]|uniref:N-(5'-phosphoribosyl)anthranilate isomerase n=1 Tax=Candidatus Vidania fulgoroideorum TaxID=881286 RepID=A0A974X9E8_9PROT|nr:phosphoribosylanthranilate isomerase [Candidatus Vidania fulgoroideae]
MFLRTRIKFCGIKRRKEVIECIKLGVDYIGFVFYRSSRRYISPAAVRNITSNISNELCLIYKVGVFVNPSFNYVKDCVSISGVDMIQVYFEEKNVDIQRISKHYKLIRCYGVCNDNTLVLSTINSSNSIFLLESKSSRYGGTGIRFNWDIIDNIPKRNVIVSGGLNHKNVSRLITNYNIYAVDVSSGIEFSNKKSFELMRRFCLSVNSKKRL